MQLNLLSHTIWVWCIIRIQHFREPRINLWTIFSGWPPFLNNLTSVEFPHPHYLIHIISVVYVCICCGYTIIIRRFGASSRCWGAAVGAELPSSYAEPCGIRPYWNWSRDAQVLGAQVWPPPPPTHKHRLVSLRTKPGDRGGKRKLKECGMKRGMRDAIEVGCVAGLDWHKLVWFCSNGRLWQSILKDKNKNI